MSGGSLLAIRENRSKSVKRSWALECLSNIVQSNMKALTVLVIVFALAGVVVSAVVLKEHYSTETSPCDINAKWDCGIVNKTPYALFHGIPVATIGIVGYALIGILAGRFPILTALAALGGLVFALRLTYYEWKVI